jgi:hypothetical protein
MIKPSQKWLGFFCGHSLWIKPDLPLATNSWLDAIRVACFGNWAALKLWYEYKCSQL